jgi:hypothetical protein
MKYRKIIVVFTVIILTFSLTACKNKLSMEEQAWNEAITYIEWFAEKNDADINPGVYSEDRVEKNSDLNYTCCVALTNSKGAYDQWYITVEKKNNGDWDVISID